MKKNVCFILFKNDFRVNDHAALNEALLYARSHKVALIGLYCGDQSFDVRPMGSASAWWLKKSLIRLNQTFIDHNSRLICVENFHHPAFEKWLSQTNITGLFLGHQANDLALSLAQTYRKLTGQSDLKPQAFLTSHLLTIGEVKTQGGGAFRVFTPFSKAARQKIAQNGHMSLSYEPLGDFADKQTDWADIDDLGLSAQNLNLGHSLTRSGADWSKGFDIFEPGENGAHKRWRDFLNHQLVHYAQDRDRPDLDLTSRLSPHLRFGEISPHRLWADLEALEAQRPDISTQIDKFRSEILWREFSYELLAQYPDLHRNNIRKEFDRFPWQMIENDLKAWQKGETGYGLVDAGMRELWQTGFMHNRVRMIAASFLIKHLMIDWRHGEAWFWDCLVDADPANNPASWQWVAGCGADAAPYFRIFNPISAAEKFDPNGLYRQKYLGDYREDDLFAKRARPLPIIDHMMARQRALTAFQSLKI